MTEINIENIDKLLLLKMLWEKSKYAAFHNQSNFMKPQWDDALAEKAITKYIDYFQGKIIKLDLSKNIIDPYLYDRDNGKNTFVNVINSIRN